MYNGLTPGAPGFEAYKYIGNRAREIVGFAGSGPIFETENRFISRQGANKSVHKTVFLKISQYTD